MAVMIFSVMPAHESVNQIRSACPVCPQDVHHDRQAVITAVIVLTCQQNTFAIPTGQSFLAQRLTFH